MKGIRARYGPVSGSHVFVLFGDGTTTRVRNVDKIGRDGSVPSMYNFNWCVLFPGRFYWIVRTSCLSNEETSLVPVPLRSSTFRFRTVRTIVSNRASNQNNSLYSDTRVLSTLVHDLLEWSVNASNFFFRYSSDNSDTRRTLPITVSVKTGVP